MFGIDNFVTFVITATFFIMTPGIDTIFVLNKSISKGTKSGIYATLGINSGIFVHTIFAALGLSIIIAKSALAFSIVKYAGAAYLIYLGISNLLSQQHAFDNIDKECIIRESNLKNYYSGVLTNVLNPKVALFFMAFFPQFIKAEALNDPLPFLFLGTSYSLIGLFWFLLVSFFASIFSEKLMNNRLFSKWMDKVSGIVFILMGIKIALTKR